MVKTMKYSAEGNQQSISTNGAKNISATVGPSRIPSEQTADDAHPRLRPVRPVADQWVGDDVQA